ncbi:hypothetical protein XIS1_1810003 [Xenorhabdus innexi]|uniref:Uncharacterized protein n=1 Tax=Xenorhabdus innexi TaxID=290109 RepID=A0A1N6MWY0_9GAMM|nr:hypothetical protein XIS1_1810003 [Xenorhabdus innexi]
MYQLGGRLTIHEGAGSKLNKSLAHVQTETTPRHKRSHK